MELHEASNMDVVDKDEWTLARPTAEQMLLKLNDTRNREKQTIMSRLHHTQQKLLQEQHWSRQVAQRCAELEDQVDRLEKENAHHVAKNISLSVQVATLQRRLIRRGPQTNLAESPPVHGPVDHMDGATKHGLSHPGKALRHKQSYTTSVINDKRYTRRHLSQHSGQHSGGPPLGSCSKVTMGKAADRVPCATERKRPVRDRMIPGRALDHENMAGMVSPLPGQYNVQRPARSKVQPSRQQPSRTSCVATTVTTATTPAAGTTNIGEKSFDFRQLLLSAENQTDEEGISPDLVRPLRRARLGEHEQGLSQRPHRGASLRSVGPRGVLSSSCKTLTGEWLHGLGTNGHLSATLGPMVRAADLGALTGATVQSFQSADKTARSQDASTMKGQEQRLQYLTHVGDSFGECNLSLVAANSIAIDGSNEAAFHGQLENAGQQATDPTDRTEFRAGRVTPTKQRTMAASTTDGGRGQSAGAGPSPGAASTSQQEPMSVMPSPCTLSGGGESQRSGNATAEHFARNEIIVARPQEASLDVRPFELVGQVSLGTVLGHARGSVPPFQLSNSAAVARIVRDSSAQAMDVIKTPGSILEPRETPKHSERRQQQQQQQQEDRDARCDGAKATTGRESKQGETLLTEGPGGHTYGNPFGEESGEDTVSEDEAETGTVLNVPDMMEDNSGSTTDGIGNPDVEALGTGAIRSSVALDLSGSSWQQESREDEVSQTEIDGGRSAGATKVELERHACEPAAADELLAK